MFHHACNDMSSLPEFMGAEFAALLRAEGCIGISHSALASAQVVEPTHLKNMLVKLDHETPRIGVKKKLFETTS